MTLDVELEGRPFRLTFPHLSPRRVGRDAFDLDGDDLGDLAEDQDPSLPWVEIDTIKISVAAQPSLAWSDFPANWTDHPALEQHVAALRAIRPEVDQIARRVFAALKVSSDQPWVLAQFGDPPLFLARLVDQEAHHRLPGGLAEDILPVPRRPTYVMAEHVGRLVDDLRAPQPEAQLLLIEAERQLLFAAPPSPRLAAVLAAMACELRTPDALRKLTPPERLALLNAALRRPKSQARLYGTVMRDACGTSIADENPELLNTVLAMIERRNHIVHGGLEPSFDDARRSVDAARELFAWFARRRI
jgi:hypothetical protein